MSSWLISSGRHNVPFDEKYGYRVVEEIGIGADDPDWDKGELIAPIVSHFVSILCVPLIEICDRW